MIYLDTHVAVWLFAGELNRFSEAALESMEAEELAISPIVLLELQYLRETDRIKSSPRALTNALARTIGLKICDLPFDDVIEAALRQRWTRDPFDRIIVAQAMRKDAFLLSKDRTILDHYKKAFWDVYERSE